MAQAPETRDFLAVMRQRGFIHQATDEDALAAALKDGPLTAYVGYDATADSLHAGSLVSLMMLRWLQKTGNRPIILMGGGTTRIGDPTWRDESRKMLDDATITANIAGIRQVMGRLFTFGDGPGDAMMVNNADWLDGLGYVDFLRDYGPHFSVNRMLTMDSVKLRLERDQPLSFLEFNYMILQAYDFLELARRHNCVLQMGGSDQWGNIIAGIELGRRVDQRQLFGLTCPLITTASGAKMGKTADGAVWLNPDRLSAWDYWQYWRNAEDADVGRFLKLYSELPMAEIARLEALQGAELNAAKAVLATEATAMIHGRPAAEEAAATAERVFAGGGLEGLPEIDLAGERLAAGVGVLTLLVEAGLAASNGEARRLVRGGGARLNDKAISDEGLVVDMAAATDGAFKLSAGRKRHVRVRLV
ncbi:MAG: tyrosine--tRNA ligase [Alphaproteobacteria bacterium]